MDREYFWGLVVASYGFHLSVFRIKDIKQLEHNSKPIFSQLDKMQTFDCKALQCLGRIVVGDWVKVEKQAEGMVVIERHERRNFLQRIGSYKKRKMHCANINQLVVVVAPVPTTGFYVVDAILILCYQQGIQPILLANKLDLCGFDEWLQKWRDYYQSANLPILSCSAETAQGMTELQGHLSNKLSFLIGFSGVGKSSLLNCLLVKEVALTQPISEANLQGQHTTSNSLVYVLPPSKSSMSGLLIDSPGVREFSLSDYTNFELAFKDIVNFAQHCRFRDCKHLNEPKCAVLEAIDAGELDEVRWSSFQHFQQLYYQ